MFDDNHKRKGLIGTILIHAILIVLFIFFGMKYQDPAPEPGIAIVFGFDEQGSGDFKPVPRVASKVTPQETVEEKEVIEEPIKESVPDVAKDVNEEMMTQDNEDSPISAEEKKKKIEEDKIAKEKRLEEERVENERLEKERVENERLEKIRKEEERVKAEQDAKKKNLDGMFSGLKNRDDATGTDANQGDDGVAGYKGSEDGKIGAKSYTGNGGVGDFGNYSLGDRKPIKKPNPDYDSTEEGTVVVRIYVNKEGIVTYAEVDLKGSNTTDPQLWENAKDAAKKTTWQRDDTAGEKQEGYIIYKFSIE